MLKRELDADQVFELLEFLSPAECDELIALSEGVGYHDAPITTSAGFILVKDVRDNLRVMHDDPALAGRLFERAREALPARRLHWGLHALNERFRFYRYDVGQKFDIHSDGCFRRSPEEESLFTFMIYLNDDFTGGETNFYHNNGRLRLSVRPERGKALVFWHRQLHEGAPVRTGRKYVLRSDVMYRQVTPPR